VNIAATALVTDAATALFGEAGVTAATGVMTVGDTLITCRVTEVVHVAVWCYDDTTDWLVFLLYGWLVMILCQVFYLHSRQ
jgi:Mg2+/Co2+ transporter CorB